MPGTSDGVDVRLVSREPLDYERYRDELVKYETAIRSGGRAASGDALHHHVEVKS